MLNFKRGDVVVHAKRPEWGEGVVTDAASIAWEGSAAQRLVIDFAHHGRVTINTAMAALMPRGSASAMDTTATSSTFTSARSAATASSDRGGWLATLGNNKPVKHEELWKLGDALTDPFAALGKRLEATLETYRFGTDPRHGKLLIDWAVAQTGLHDPLTKYTRHELEQAFPRYNRDRDQHLNQLVYQLKKSGRMDVVMQVMNNTSHPLAKAALQRMIKG